ncbi:MAG: delta-60 repeat domain-containing protein [Verrucomicrobiota bacterium]
MPIPDDGVVSPDFATTLRLRVRQGTATVGPAGTASLRVQENDFAQSPGRGVAGTVAAIIPAATGGVYIAGEFTAVHGVPRQNVARLLPNGEVDPGFELKEGPDGPITALLLLSDGRLLIAGDFSTIGGQTRKRIARVLEDGRLDPSFDPGRGPGNGSEKPQLLTIGMLGDGRLLVGGVFQEFGGHTGRGIARLQSDGGVDTTFTSPLVSSSAIVKQPSLDPAPTGGAVTEVHPLPDGQVLVVGDLQYFARFPIHVPTAATATQPGDGAIAAAKMWGFGATSTSATALLLQPDGSIDLGFPPRSLKLPAITTISLLTNDWFLAGEAYPSVWLPRPGTNWIAVERLRLSGQPDPDFVVRNLPPFPLVASRVNRLVPQPDGKILFLAQARAGLPVSSPGVCVIGRLLPDGQWDSTFQLVTALDPFAGIMTPRFPFNDPESDSFVELPGSISSVAQQPDGVMTIGGSFTEINQEPRPRLARLQPDGELRGQLTPLIGIATSRVIDLRAGPEVPIPYVMQSSADLVHWSNLSTNASPWKGAQFELDSAGLGAWQFFRMVPLP